MKLAFSGYTVLELIIAGSISVIGISLLYRGVVTFNQRVRGNSYRAAAQMELATLALQISRMGMFSRGCTKISASVTVLECSVDFATGTAETVRFQFNPRTKLFTLSRNGIIYNEATIADFRVCTGTEIKNRTCPETRSTAWEGTALNGISLANYYRFELTVDYDSTGKQRGAATPSTYDLKRITLGSGFFARNTATAPFKYVWTPWSGKER